MRTAVFDTIKSLQPYFFSLREIYAMTDNPLVSLDIKIPAAWDSGEYPDTVTLKIQDQNEHYKLISVIAPNTKDGYDSIFTVVKKIIKENKEKEEKARLFNQKMEELKTLFLSSPLDKLKTLSFDKYLDKDGIRDRQSAGETKMGGGEGQGSDGSNQTENDRGN